PALTNLVADPDPQVRLQLAYSLGLWDDDPKAAEALAQLAVRDGGDRFAAAAVLSSVTKKNLEPVLLAVLSESKTSPAPPAVVEGLLRTATAQGNTKALSAALSAVATPKDDKYAPWQFAALAGLLDALDQRNTPLAKLADEGDEGLKAAVKRLPSLFDAARAAMSGKDTPRSEQLLAVRLLGRGPDHQKEDLAALTDLLTPQTPDDLQAAAVATLGRLRDPNVPEVLLKGWRGYGPGLRSQVLDVLFRRPDWLKAALDAVEKKQVLPFEIDAARRQQLLQHKDAAGRGRAAKLFTDAVDPDRQKVVDAYRGVLTRQGDAVRGAPLFAKTCSACHRFNGVGNAVGPDLASLGDKSPESLLIAILDPNRA